LSNSAEMESFVELALASGSLVAGRYSIQRVLGQGGFAITYLARDVQLDREVALKELCPEGSSRDGVSVIPGRTFAPNFQETKRRFVDEARTLASLKHRNVVSVFEVIETNQTAYIVMEFVDGWSVADAIASTGRFAQTQVRWLMDESLGALEYLHERNLLHRDITPANLMIDQSGRLVLIDFGSARKFAARTSNMTKIVTAGYSPIEQYADGEVTPAADLYALSATAFHAQTGSPPPAATDRVATFADLPDWPPFNDPDASLTAAITSGLAIRPDDRPQSVRAFRDVMVGNSQAIPVPTLVFKSPSSPSNLTVLVAGNPQAGAAGSPAVIGGSQRKNWIPLALSGGLALALAGVVVGLLASNRNQIVVPVTTVVAASQSDTAAPANSPDTEFVGPAETSQTPTPTPTPTNSKQPDPASVISLDQQSESQSVTTTPPASPTTKRTYSETTPAQPPSPQVDTIRLGVSVNGKTITARRVGVGSRRVLVIGGLKGDQVEGVDPANQLAAAVQQRGLSDVSLYVISHANPDGMSSGRAENARGVDLNRNFPARNFQSDASNGTGWLSEPETKAVVGLVEREQWDLVIVMFSSTSGPYVNWDGPAESAADSFSQSAGFELKSSGQLAPTPGSFGNWAGRDLNFPVVNVFFKRGTRNNWSRVGSSLVNLVSGR
jgi:serine/threonine protein kinase